MEANFRMRSIISILKFKKLIDVFEKFIYEKNWGDRVHVGILPLNLARISSIYRLTGSFVVCVNHGFYTYCLGIILTCVSEIHMKC